MRRDWDYVSMSDYAADTKEIAETAAAALLSMRKESDTTKRMAMEAVIAAGGSVTVPAQRLRDTFAEYNTEFWRNDQDDTITIKVQRTR